MAKMLKCKLKEIIADINRDRAVAAAAEKGEFEKLTIATIARDVPIAYNTLSRLYDDKAARFDRKTLAAVCDYFNFTSLDELFDLVDIDQSAA